MTQKSPDLMSLCPGEVESRAAGDPGCPWGLGVPALLLVLTVPGVCGAGLAGGPGCPWGLWVPALLVLAVPGVCDAGPAGGPGVSGYQPCWWSWLFLRSGGAGPPVGAFLGHCFVPRQPLSRVSLGPWWLSAGLQNELKGPPSKPSEIKALFTSGVVGVTAQFLE